MAVDTNDWSIFLNLKPKTMQPSNYAKISPYMSVTKNRESEIVIRNIMTILARTGDTWRTLPLEEYIQERQKDGHYTPREIGFFNKVVGYTVSEEKAKTFAPVWWEVGHTILKRKGYFDPERQYDKEWYASTLNLKPTDIKSISTKIDGEYIFALIFLHEPFGS